MRYLQKIITIIILLGITSGCSSTALPQRGDGITDIVATTPIIADIASNIAGENARVTSLVPSNADPHSYEPTLRDIRNIANADLALTNYMLLEEHSIIRAIESNTQPDTKIITLAEDAAKYGAHVIPLVENVKLDTIWLGMRVRGDGTHLGATRSSEVRLTATQVRGPGNVSAYLTTTFGTPQIYFNSADGFNKADGYEHDTATLPVDAHTHVSWAFSKAGIYEVDFKGSLVVDSQSKPMNIGQTTITFAVGVDPHAHASTKNKKYILDKGHEDITVNLENMRLEIEGDDSKHATQNSTEESSSKHNTVYNPENSVIVIPNKALQQIPAEDAYRFLGKPGDETYMLPQAVLGKHVHGEIDPHLWMDPNNAIAYAKVIRDSLIEVDPKNAENYTINTQNYTSKLAELHEKIQEIIDEIPAQRRYLVTTHDAYAYFGQAYNMSIAGFVTPNPAIEPSTRDLVTLTKTLQNLHVPAVFLEPQLANKSNDLTQLANRLNIQVCRIYSDSFDTTVTNYVDMMLTNAKNMRQCLGS
ncbi:MAG: anchored repeat ABC transporter, substrate-binding protein [Bifidobacteriaceae bacterium]|nr:anchored repeat ABC transporter, substrate-binding protein [Bifidobacteriaceae bacterium]